MNDRELAIELDVDARGGLARPDGCRGVLGWFASDARTELRPGGDWELASGEYRMTSRVDEIEAPKRLRVVAPPREGFAVTTEFVVEARGGRTVVRIVESGFGPRQAGTTRSARARAAGPATSRTSVTTSRTTPVRSRPPTTSRRRSRVRQPPPGTRSQRFFGRSSRFRASRSIRRGRSRREFLGSETAVFSARSSPPAKTA
jgi:uncharacterized protein YndB with AHSA1/START domain